MGVASKKPLVGVFIPCHNEADIIAETIKTVKKYITSKAFPYDGKIILVDDGSSDNSLEIAKKAGADVLYQHPVNQGLGAATRSGMEIAHYIGCDAFAKFDADLQHDVNDIYASVKPIIENKTDVLYASRFAGKIHYKMPLIRFMGNRFFTWLMRRITGWKITDSQTGLMCFSRRYLAIFEMPGTYNPPQQALFDASRKGMRYAEVSAHFYQRKTGNSFVKWKYIRKVFSTLAKLSFFYYSFQMFTLFGMLLLLIGVIALVKGLIGYFFFTSPLYVPHATLVTLTFTTGILSILFGLQSYAQINRIPYIRNGEKNYRYVVLENIIYNTKSVAKASGK